VAAHTPNPAIEVNSAATAGIPGSAAAAHPTDGIPLPAHGFAKLDVGLREVASIPAADVISQSAAVLMNAAGEKLGLAPGEEPDLDLVEARTLINALAGLLAAAGDALDEHREPLHHGLGTLQAAFREASVHPDAPGEGPGEAYLS
jgi:hypothetical protein